MTFLCFIFLQIAEDEDAGAGAFCVLPSFWSAGQKPDDRMRQWVTRTLLLMSLNLFTKSDHSARVSSLQGRTSVPSMSTSPSTPRRPSPCRSRPRDPSWRASRFLVYPPFHDFVISTGNSLWSLALNSTSNSALFVVSDCCRNSPDSLSNVWMTRNTEELWGSAGTSVDCTSPKSKECLVRLDPRVTSLKWASFQP